MHDALFADQGRLDPPHLWERCERLGIDVTRFEADRRTDAIAERVRADFRTGIRAGVMTTPTLFVGGIALSGRARRGADRAPRWMNTEVNSGDAPVALRGALGAEWEPASRRWPAVARPPIRPQPTKEPRLVNSLLRALGAALCACAFTAAPALAEQSDHGKPPFDIRDRQHQAAPVPDTAAQVAGRAHLGDRLGDQGVLDYDAQTNTPRVVAKLDGFLTGPSSAAPADIAIGYVRSHLSAFGLTNDAVDSLQLVRNYTRRERHDAPRLGAGARRHQGVRQRPARERHQGRPADQRLRLADRRRRHAHDRPDAERERRAARRARRRRRQRPRSRRRPRTARPTT